MTVLKRWVLATLAAATVAAVGASGSDSPSDGDRQERRQRIEQMGPDQKRELLEKEERFSNLSPDKQEQLWKLHRDLQAQENRGELEQVMESYFEWVCTLSASERSELDKLSPEERVNQVIKYKASSRRPFGRRIPGNPIGRMGPAAFIRDYADALKTWAGRYATNRADELARLLPAGEGEKWKASLEQAHSNAPEKEEKTRWLSLVRWYLAGPEKDLPLNDGDVAEFEKLLSPDVKKWFDRFTPEERIREVRDGLRRMIHYHFDTGEPEFKDLISTEQLSRFSQGLSDDQQENLKRFPSERQRDLVRLFYFISKLPEDSFGNRGHRGFSGAGRPPYGDSNREGPSGPRRGPDGEFRDRFPGPPPGPPPGEEPPEHRAPRPMPPNEPSS